MSLEHTPRLRARARIFLVMTPLGILGAFWLLDSYKIDLVHQVVVNAVIQKAPADYPGDHIARVFQRARKEATESLREQEYLEKLLRLSQRLEKVQWLARDQVEEILEELLALSTLSPDKAALGFSPPAANMNRWFALAVRLPF